VDTTVFVITSSQSSVSEGGLATGLLMGRHTACIVTLVDTDTDYASYGLRFAGPAL
jgi:hypothetical protein